MKKYSNVTLITTHWDSSVQEKYQSQVYVLDPLLKRRLGIEYTPSLVEQEGTKVRVTELRARP